MIRITYTSSNVEWMNPLKDQLDKRENERWLEPIPFGLNRTRQAKISAAFPCFINFHRKHNNCNIFSILRSNVNLSQRSESKQGSNRRLNGTFKAKACMRTQVAMQVLIHFVSMDVLVLWIFRSWSARQIPALSQSWPQSSADTHGSLWSICIAALHSENCLEMSLLIRSYLDLADLEKPYQPENWDRAFAPQSPWSVLWERAAMRRNGWARLGSPRTVLGCHITVQFEPWFCWLVLRIWEMKWYW
jgi:hypothetical protein